MKKTRFISCVGRKKWKVVDSEADVNISKSFKVKLNLIILYKMPTLPRNCEISMKEREQSKDF